MPMPRRALVVVALALLLPRCAFAGRSPRTKSVSPERAVSTLVLDPTDPRTLYAGTGSGLFRSRDGGDSWTKVSTMAVGALAIAPSSPNVLYAAGGPTVSRSDDGGATWSLLKDFGGAFVTVTTTTPAVDPTDGNRVYLGVNEIGTGGGGTVWRSVDGGQSWAGLFGPFPFVGIVAIDPRSPHGVFAEVGGLARSLDGGATWAGAVGLTSTVLSLAFPAGAPEVVVAGTNGSGVFVSRDGGATFVAASSGLSGDALFVQGVAPVAGSPNSLFAATLGGLYRTDDLGASWRKIDPEDWFLLQSDPSSASTLYAVNDGVFKSTDGGVTWAESDEGIFPIRPISPVPGCDPHSSRSEVSAESVVVDPRDPDRVVAVADRTVLRSVASGCLGPGDDGLQLPPPSHQTDAFVLSLDPQQPDTLYLGSSQGVFKSTDGGRSWLQRSNGIPFVIGEADVGKVAVDPARSDVLFVSGLFGVFRSENGGESWEQVNNGFPVGTNPGGAFAFDPRNTDVVYLASFRLFKTLDGAQLWQASDQGLPGGAYSVAVDLRNPDVVHAGTADGLYVSHDAGASWALEGLTGRAVYDVQQKPLQAGVFIAQTDAGLFRSTNGGVLWSPLATPFPADSIREFALAPSDPATLYAATATGVFRSSDDGATWTLLGIDRRAPRFVVRAGEQPQ
ncbi:MAG TPA: hypothetical protein VGH97_12355 [Thermoanaerobaculia bacterium]|jgi:photosystem II stability/assembly factor-like uncharacterized protein